MIQDKSISVEQLQSILQANSICLGSLTIAQAIHAALPPVQKNKAQTIGKIHQIIFDFRGYAVSWDGCGKVARAIHAALSGETEKDKQDERYQLGYQDGQIAANEKISILEGKIARVVDCCKSTEETTFEDDTLALVDDVIEIFEANE